MKNDQTLIKFDGCGYNEAKLHEARVSLKGRA